MHELCNIVGNKSEHKICTCITDGIYRIIQCALLCYGCVKLFMANPLRVEGV